MDYLEYLNEIPRNTLQAWSRDILGSLKWTNDGWSGASKEPYRHWTSFTDLKSNLSVQNLWDCINSSFKEDGFNLTVNRVIGNLYAHGDSSWLHVDSNQSKDYTAIVYLNEFWDLNWGGQTILVEDNEIIKSFAPTPGKFILFKSDILHGPCPVSREAPYPRLGLTFQCTNANII